MFLHIICLIFPLNPNSHHHTWQPCIKSCNQMATCNYWLLPAPYSVILFFANNNILGQHHVAITCHFISLWYHHLYYFFPLVCCCFFLLLTTWELLLPPTSYNRGVIISFYFLQRCIAIGLLDKVPANWCT
jgi:hypothetical protein